MSSASRLPRTETRGERRERYEQVALAGDAAQPRSLPASEGIAQP